MAEAFAENLRRNEGPLIQIAPAELKRGRPLPERLAEGPMREAVERPIRRSTARLAKQVDQQLPKTTLRNTNETLDGVLTIFTLFGCKATAVSEATKAHWGMLAKAAGSWMKAVKWKLTAFFNYHRDLPLPPSPWKDVNLDDPAILLGGQPNRWFRAFKLRAKHSTAERQRMKEFLLSIRIGVKKGAPRPSQEDLRTKEAEHVRIMTTEKPQSPEQKLETSWAERAEIPDEIPDELTVETMKSQLRRTVRELFGATTYTVEDRLKMMFPSTSANYILNRKKGGAVAAVVESPTLLEGLRRPGGYLDVKSEKEVSAPEEEHAVAVTERLIEGRTILDDSRLREVFRTYWHRLLVRAVERPNLVEPVGLAEALKVRVITKSDPIRQTVLRSLWKKMHTVLRQHPTFILLDRPETEEIVNERIGDELLPNQLYLSGDYEAATDNLHSWVSETVADEIASIWNLGPEEHKLFREGLTGHIYGDKPQRRGQLMGSVVSFPVLCVANAAMSRWSMELAERRLMLLRDSPLLINGDDVGLRAHKRVYGYWQKITSFGGLHESLGKTYATRQFIEINSRCFERGIPTTRVERLGGHRLRILPIGLYKTKFVNLGLVLGMKRSQGSIGLSDLDSPEYNLGARGRKLVDSSPEELAEPLMRLFILRHKELLQKTRLPWFIPTWLGGIGLPSGPWGHPSDLDLRIARRILLNWKEERPRPLGQAGDWTWRMHALAESRLPEPAFVTERGALTEVWDRLVGLHTVNLLFDSKVTMAELKELTDPRAVHRAVRTNAKLWSPALRVGKSCPGLPEPLQESLLEFHARFPAAPPTASAAARLHASLVVGTVAQRSAHIPPRSSVEILNHYLD